MKNTQPKKTQQTKFVKGKRVISQPGAKVVVTELILTEYGRKAITTGSQGIKEGASEIFGPSYDNSDYAPA